MEPWNSNIHLGRIIFVKVSRPMHLVAFFLTLTSSTNSRYNRLFPTVISGFNVTSKWGWNVGWTLMPCYPINRKPWEAFQCTLQRNHRAARCSGCSRARPTRKFFLDGITFGKLIISISWSTWHQCCQDFLRSMCPACI